MFRSRLLIAASAAAILIVSAACSGTAEEAAPTAVGLITDDMMEEFCVIGTWDELPGRMREKYAGINTQIGFAAGEPKNPDEADQIREIISELKTIPTVGEV
ncbi:MAG: hypothetical protein O2919_10890 [Chloroflexi bacterium]|nr:hypothetical protein [Chloroflexota bacterium]